VGEIDFLDNRIGYTGARPRRARFRGAAEICCQLIRPKAGLPEIIVTTHWGGIVERFVDDVVILDVRGGEISFSKNLDQLLNAIRQLVQRGSRKILLNLRDVRYIDSDGLREIIEGFQTTRNGGGILKLCEVVPGIRRLLNVTKLDEIIEVFESEDAALRSYAAQL
jgi:anti-sigma B factor antagonist